VKGFAGFPRGELRFTPIPTRFFSELLPIIDDIAELKVTLYCFLLLAPMDSGALRAVSFDDLLADPLLLEGLESSERSGTASLKHGLERAVARGTLLLVTVHRDGDPESWYLLNSELGRDAVCRLQEGNLSDFPKEYRTERVGVQFERPNTFVLYEQNIGPLTPLIVEELREAEQTFNSAWIEEAIRIAVEQNVRRWRYVRAILERWRSEGKDGGTRGRSGDEDDRYRYIRGDYAEFIEH
jgi:DnaD/phage-associated family protein